ncbi:Lrp/AsnC family transcriptional regulator [Novispirillum itersonii]|uniref:DNA-binding Lrp family transcriptional regulator n=1 Tax=Novispirillum itersonii TaxID=189 RepID=A0A7X0DK90_NOVIT|nr:Lrp/AsnC family transcriptional regulator [Novispirillum itersonii]MBB6208710.1 DNA-binding Lrp family transcriptional regulator [Novispirillum itersonii]
MAADTTLDEKDRLLLAALRRDARRPLVALARDIGLSRSATQDRLNRLLKTGVLSGFTTVEPQAPEARACAHLLIRHHPGHSCAPLLPHLRRMPAVVAIHAVAGATDMMLRVEAATIREIEETRSAVFALPGIAEITTLIVLDRYLG